MIFLRAIPFSFAILWRYALVLPILIIALAVFGIVAAVLISVIGFIAPFFALLMIIAFAFASSTVPIMVGMRVGLQAKGIKPRSNYLSMMVPALGYGLFEGLAILIILVLCAALYLVATPLGLSDFTSFDSDNAESFALALFDASPVVSLILLAVGGSLVIALRAALLVPFAGASIGADPDGKSHTPFMGFGGALASNIALVTVSYAGSALVVPIVLVLSVPLGAADALTQTAALIEQTEVDPVVETPVAEPTARISGSILAPVATPDEIPEPVPVSPIDGVSDVWADLAVLAAIALFLYLFFFSLQCAGAVLYFTLMQASVKRRHKEFDKQAAKDEAAAADAPMQETDLRELLRSRMPDRKY